MNSEYYEVWIDNVCVAQYMSLGHALILIKALFCEYYNDLHMDIHIKKMIFDVQEEKNEK